MSLLDPRLWLAFAIGVALTGFGGYIKGRSDGRAVERNDAQEEIQAWRDNAAAAFDLYLKAKDQKAIEYRTITKTVEVAKNATPDIPDCRTGDDWMRIFQQNAAIANGAPLPSGSGGAIGSDAR